MSRFLSKRFAELTPYTPGEQPRDQQYIKLNTNESPFPPSPKVLEAINEEEVKKLNLYPDPTASALTKKLAEYYGVDKKNVILSNGSDDILNFSFMAFCDNENGAVFPEISYGFYEVFAHLCGIKFKKIPLKSDFSIHVPDYYNAGGMVVIANPNAPTGLALSVEQIESIVKANPDRVVLIDEAYVDFGAESAVPLTKKYGNLLVVGTFSKSRSLAGARVGFGIASKEIIKDLDKLRNSTNPYNVNSMSLAAAAAALDDNEYYVSNCKKIETSRKVMSDGLKALGFELTDSTANFVFAKHPKIDGKELYLKLREEGVLVRHFDADRISEYNRITVGSESEVSALLSACEKILKGTN